MDGMFRTFVTWDIWDIAFLLVEVLGDDDERDLEGCYGF